MNKLDLKLLELLHQNKGNYISGESISNILGVSRTAVWKHIKYLREKGYKIESVTNKGYSLLEVSEKIIPEEISLGLKTRIVGKEIFVYDCVNSTNDEAKKLAREGCPAGTVIVAEEQKNGKGRLGRNWYSSAGTGLWFSIIIRPELTPNLAPFLTIVAALTVYNSLVDTIGEDIVSLKWPNDVLVNDKKVCGILSELNADLGMINYAIIGIGINVNQDEFPEEIKDKATSLKKEVGKEVNRTLLLQNTLNYFEGFYSKLIQGEHNILLQLWKGSLALQGKEVSIYSSDRVYLGKVKDISDQGELILEDVNGNIHSFWAGDVSLR